MESEETVIADGDPMGISAEVLKDALDSIEGWFAIDAALFMIEVMPQLFKVLRRFEVSYPVGEYQGT